MIIPTFLKWAGGKKRLIKDIERSLPKKIDRYFEPFLGAGAIFFYIKQKYNPKFCVISDINKDLIDTFKAVIDNPKELIKFLKYFKKNNSKEFYYRVRDKFNKGKFKQIQKSAAFIYLNKTCYNGLYRVNSKGGFNVPYGKYKNPEIFNEKTIMFASRLLKNVRIKCQNYEKIKDYIRKNDFVYLDPCYDPLKKTSFANYTPKRFCDVDNEKLSLFVAELKRRNSKVLLSNNITKNVKRLYPKNQFNIIKVWCSRSINCIGEKRGKIPELLIKNY
ncbi:MAG: Dam family site-specific DNA-(adenine-N6)-methyltransferase [Candidatus Pacearchaeota archaeon]|nr:MAG: Dam family site-specific DNA-(adenine-N6)-methyltransferase [Candidatus Pacearchaeota archaeon]